jgi:hypothetical protein
LPQSSSTAEKPENTIDVDIWSDLRPDGRQWYLRGNSPASANGLGITFDVAFPIRVFSTTIHNAGMIGLPEYCDSFESCFPDLFKAAQSAGNLKVTDLKNYLLQQIEKGDSVFDAFGLKIPLDQLTFWGIVVVLSVQLYFFLHVREFHAKIKASDSGWDALNCCGQRLLSSLRCSRQVQMSWRCQNLSKNVHTRGIKRAPQ